MSSGLEHLAGGRHTPGPKELETIPEVILSGFGHMVSLSVRSEFNPVLIMHGSEPDVVTTFTNVHNSKGEHSGELAEIEKPRMATCFARGTSCAKELHGYAGSSF